MKEKKSLSDQCIIDCLKVNYGIEAVTLIPITFGADMNASVYQAQAFDKSSYFIKIKHDEHDVVSVILQRILYDAGIRQIIPPFKTLSGQATQQICDCIMIVYPFIEGENGFNRNLSDDQWILLGNVLRKVHAFAVPSSIKDQIRRETYSPKWREAVRSLLTHIQDVPHGDAIAQKLLAFIKENRAIIYRLVERAEQLRQKIQQQSPEFVLCHSDIHGGNVLIEENGAIYIVDWDEPILAPKERDLMFIGGGVANVWNNPREEELYYQGYGKVEINKTILSYYRHERIVEDIAQYCNDLILTKGGEDRPKMYTQFMDMFVPEGVVDIAFNTDINYQASG